MNRLASVLTGTLQAGQTVPVGPEDGNAGAGCREDCELMATTRCMICRINQSQTMRPTITRLLSAICVVTISLTVNARLVLADITRDVATQIYTPEFDDWVLVYANAILRDSCPDYNLSVTKEPTVNGVRFHVVGSYANTPAGLNWYRTEGSKVRDRIAAICRGWTNEGFTISPNDFEIDLRKRH